MANQAKTLLVAGMLSLAASTAFADNRAQLAQNAAPQATTQQAQDPNTVKGEYSFMSKDGKPIKMNFTYKMLDKGQVPSPQFGQALVGAGNMMAMQEFIKYNAADIAANIPAIEKAMTEGMTKFMMMGVTPKGEVIYGKPGVNYGPVVVDKVTTTQDNKVIYEKKAEPAKPAPTTTKPAAGTRNA
ncbi:MAG: hypothetical protein ACAH80_13300 [Alphaproteobacteria bacterium]